MLPAGRRRRPTDHAKSTSKDLLPITRRPSHNSSQEVRMQTLNQLETEPLPIEEEESRHTRRLLVGVLCALLLTGSVCGGYLFLRKRHERQVAATAAAAKIEKEKAKVEVAVDEART